MCSLWNTVCVQYTVYFLQMLLHIHLPLSKIFRFGVYVHKLVCEDRIELDITLVMYQCRIFFIFQQDIKWECNLTKSLFLLLPQWKRLYTFFKINTLLIIRGVSTSCSTSQHWNEGAVHWVHSSAHTVLSQSNLIIEAWPTVSCCCRHA